MTNQQIIEKLKGYIVDYIKVEKTQSIDELLDLQDKISGLSFYFAEIVGDLKITYNYQHFQRKIHVARSKQVYLSAGETLGKSDNMALIDNEEAFNAQVESEGEAFKADLLLKQVNKILSAIQQRISYLKIEKTESKRSE